MEGVRFFAPHEAEADSPGVPEAARKRPRPKTRLEVREK